MTRRKKPTAKHVSETNSALPTFADHIHELRGRLFYVALAFVVAAGLAYPFFEHIVGYLTKPLGGTELYYLTPGGGLTFIIKVCMYIGFIGMLPVAVYQLYRFIAPVMKPKNTRSIMLYTVASTVLAAAGVAFAYFISLPAALHFLTSIELLDIKPMLTIDAYMSFVGAYLLAGALLFQLPLILLLINSVTPTPPRVLMRYQKHIIVAAFVFAAIVSPTPDIVNQTILALPIIVTYQIGIVAVWLTQRSGRKAAKRVSTAPAAAQPLRIDEKLLGKHVVALWRTQFAPPVAAMEPARSKVSRRNIDVILAAEATKQAPALARHDRRLRPVVETTAPRKTIDGFFVSAPA